MLPSPRSANGLVRVFVTNKWGPVQLHVALCILIMVLYFTFPGEKISSWKIDVTSVSSFPLSLHRESDFSASWTHIMVRYTQKAVCIKHISIHKNSNFQ